MLATANIITLPVDSQVSVQEQQQQTARILSKTA